MALENTHYLLTISHLLYEEKVAMILSNLAHLYINLHEYDKSKKYFLYALNFYEKQYLYNPNKCSRDFSITQTNFAILYEEIGDYNEAESLYTIILNREEEKYLASPEKKMVLYSKIAKQSWKLI